MLTQPVNRMTSVFEIGYIVEIDINKDRTEVLSGKVNVSGSTAIIAIERLDDHFKQLYPVSRVFLTITDLKQAITNVIQ